MAKKEQAINKKEKKKKIAKRRQKINLIMIMKW